MIVFEDIIVKYIGKSAVEVTAEIEEGDDPLMFPMHFASMLEKDYLVRFKVAREYNIERGYKDYNVEFITDDEDLLAKYKEISLGV